MKTLQQQLLSARMAVLGAKGGKTPTDKKKGFAAMSKAKHMAASREGGRVKTKRVVAR